jgi:hypothetical protein
MRDYFLAMNKRSASPFLKDATALTIVPIVPVLPMEAMFKENCDPPTTTAEQTTRAPQT